MEIVMSIDANKEIVSEFFARFSASDIGGALELMADDSSWLIVGKPELLQAAGSHTKEQIARVFYRMVGQLKNGLKLTVTTMVAEGDRVVKPCT